MQTVIKKPMQVYTLFRRQRDVLVLFLLALTLYSVFRFEFLLWNWSQYRNSSWSDVLWAFFVGLRFDLSANCYLALPLFLLALIPWPSRLWPRLVFCLFFVLQLPLMILNTVDIEFINFVGRRFTKQSLFILNEATGKVSDLVGTYALVLILQIFLFALFFWLAWRKINKVSDKGLPQEAKKSSNQPIRILFVFLFLIFYVMGSRGGVQKKPISFVDANVFSAPVMNSLVLNTSFTILKSFTKDRVAREKFFAQKNEFLPYHKGSITNDS